MFSGKNVTSKCDEKQFQCGNGACIPIRFLCDGDSDCLDHSDEMIETCKFRGKSFLNLNCFHTFEATIILLFLINLIYVRIILDFLG